MEVKWMKVYLDWESAFEPYTDAEIGRLFLGMMEYVRTGDEPAFEGNEKYVWPMLKNAIDKDIEARENISKTRAEAGRIGGQAKKSKPKQNKQMPANGSKAKQTKQEIEEIKDIKIQSKEKESKEKESRRSEKLQTAIDDWLQYKKERRQDYKPTGRTALLKKIDSMAAQYGEDAVVDCINLSMSNGWQGIIWDRINDGQRQSGGQKKMGQRTVPQSEIDERMRKDEAWLQQFMEKQNEAPKGASP